MPQKCDLGDLLATFGPGQAGSFLLLASRACDHFGSGQALQSDATVPQCVSRWPGTAEEGPKAMEDINGAQLRAAVAGLYSSDG